MTILDLTRPRPPIAVAHAAPHFGTLVDGRYRLTRRLTARRTSQVWRACDERLRRTVAVKRVPSPARAALEAHAAASVNHPGIVRVYDVVDDGTGGAWLVMEDLGGASLAVVLRDENQLCARETVYVGQHVLDALAALHDAGLVHRDVKPSNLQLTADGRVVLLDFGLAVAPCTTGGATHAPIAGSLAYLAPEIVEYGRYSAQSDLYALGLTLFTSISGFAPVRLGWKLELPELDRLVDDIAAKLTDHGELLAVISGLLQPRFEERMHGAAARQLLTLGCSGVG